MVPTKYFEKTTQRLTTASKSPLKVRYKIPKGHICKEGICIKTSFLMVENISQQMVLGTPFLTNLYPFKVDRKGLESEYNGQTIIFEFLSDIEIKEVNNVQINEIQRKRNQVKFLEKEIHYKRIEDALETKALQERIKQVQNNIDKLFSEIQIQIVSNKNKIFRF